MTGEPSSGSRDAYADISPARLPAPQRHVVMISGTLDKLVPPYVAYTCARGLRDKRKAPVELVDIPKAGHFDLVTPGTPAWAEVNRTIAAALGLGP